MSSVGASTCTSETFDIVKGFKVKIQKQPQKQKNNNMNRLCELTFHVFKSKKLLILSHLCYVLFRSVKLVFTINRRRSKLGHKNTKELDILHTVIILQRLY